MINRGTREQLGEILFSKMSKGIDFKWDYEGEVTNMRLANMKDSALCVLQEKSTCSGSYY